MANGLKFYGPGEWDRLKHGEKRRAWRKLHIAVDADTGEILAHLLTDSGERQRATGSSAAANADAAMAGPLVEGAGGRIRSVIADGVYDGAPVYEAIRAARPPRSPPKIVIPPSAASIPTCSALHGDFERERHAAEIAAHGRMAWQEANGYGKRALVETTVCRLKRRGSDRLTARTFGAQQKETALRISADNKAIRYSKPVIVRIV
ncbi:MAG: transposase [Pseudomonadota bacterium]